MIRSLISCVSAAVLALALGVVPASAQTSGPAKPTSPAAPATGPAGSGLPGLPKPATNLLNEQNFPQFLKNMGLNPQEQLVNGKRYWLVHKDGWTFVLGLRAVRNQNGALIGHDLFSPLGAPLSSPDAVPASRLLKLLQGNALIIPAMYTYVEQERQVYQLLAWGPQVSQESFTREVNFFLTTIMNNRSLWDQTTW